MEDAIKKMREERTAREEARLKKLREMNLKKYPKSELQSSASAILPVEKNSKTGTIPKPTQPSVMKTAKSGTQVNCKRPITAPVPVKKPDYSNIKSKVMTKFAIPKNSVKVETKSSVKVDSRMKTSTKSQGKIPVPKSNVIGNKSAPNVLSKPDIIITEAKEINPQDVASNNQTSDTKITENCEDKTTSGINDITTKPDILMTTENYDETDNFDEKKVLTDITKKKTINTKLFPRNDVKLRKSLAAPSTNFAIDKPKNNTRKSMLPRLAEGTKSESVFERLYKPKIVARKTDQKPEPEKKEITVRKARSSDLMYNIHLNTLLGKKPQAKFHQRRSISAVHFKRISKSEANNCIHKWGSIGDNLDKVGLKNEDDEIKEDKVVSAIKSERKKVQFMTPVYSNFNTPKPDELQARLRSWLQKRGKSLSSYHHLQCFGLHHLKTNLTTPRPMKFEDALESPARIYDEENKENIALDSDSDDGSISELLGMQKEDASSGDKIDVTNWRNVSVTSESAFNDSCNSHRDHMNDLTLTPASSVNNIDELLYGALNDLSTLLREGFDWQQVARWLRSIRQQFPAATSSAAYWECRAALEDARGNLTASVECWKEAIAKGTEESVVDSNLDQLLNKFMQLKISPQSGAAKQGNSKLVDVKNVFKSTIIRFAVQQAKLRNKSAPSTPYTVTPVRRSTRLSQHVSRTPLRLCDTMRQAATIAPEHVFTPNENFVHTP